MDKTYKEEFRLRNNDITLGGKPCRFDVVKYENEPVLHVEPYMPYYDDNGCRYYTDTPYLTGEEERIWHRNFVLLDGTPMSESEKKLFQSAIGKIIDFTFTLDCKPECFDRTVVEDVCQCILPEFSRAYEDEKGKPFVFTSCY